MAYEPRESHRKVVACLTTDMVAISLYRGNLHRVPDVPRRWLMPERSISFKDFRCLLRRRSVALSRHLPSSTSNPSPSPNNPGEASHHLGPSVERTDVGIWGEGTSGAVASEEVKDKVEIPKVLTGEIPKKNVEDSSPVADVTEESRPFNVTAKTQPLPEEEKPKEPLNVKSKTTEKGEVSTEREKRKKEVEEKLQVLTAKKHNLVQVLKQILNAEEELKRRSSMAGTAMRPAVSLQVDVTYDAVPLATKHPTPKAGTKANQAGDAEGGVADDGSNHNVLSQRVPRMSSTSPSPESALGKPALSQLNLVAHPARANLAATSTGSPSRFGPLGQPSHPAAVSLSGTNYLVSSPSPAASGGTCVFKDAAR